MIKVIMKEPKEYKEQVQLLKKKNIIIKNERKAEEFLSRVNYYKLSGYYLPYINKDNEKVKERITFNKIERLYNFDRELSSLILKVICDIEIYLRTSIAYYHAHKYGAIGYENSDFYNTRHDHSMFMKNIEDIAKRNRQNPTIIHHNKFYGGHYPIWVIIEFFELGKLSYFYKDMINFDKTEIAYSLYKINYQKLDNWFSCLNLLRNKCCHFSRLFYSIFSSTPLINSFGNYKPDNKLFSQIMVLKELYPNRKIWIRKFIVPLIWIICKYRVLNDLKYMNFPNNWLNLLIEN